MSRQRFNGLRDLPFCFLLCQSHQGPLNDPPYRKSILFDTHSRGRDSPSLALTWRNGTFAGKQDQCRRHVRNMVGHWQRHRRTPCRASSWSLSKMGSHASRHERIFYLRMTECRVGVVFHSHRIHESPLLLARVTATEVKLVG